MESDSIAYHAVCDAVVMSEMIRAYTLTRIIVTDLMSKALMKEERVVILFKDYYRT
jgi:hypothetical protein